MPTSRISELKSQCSPLHTHRGQRLSKSVTGLGSPVSLGDLGEEGSLLGGHQYAGEEAAEHLGAED